MTTEERLNIIQNALSWQQEAPGRTVSIDVGKVANGEHFGVYVYDTGLMHGAQVANGAPIDLQADQLKRKREEFERLRKELGE